MPNTTVRLDTLQAPAGTRLADVTDGRLAWADSRAARAGARGVSGGWQADGAWLIDVGQGIADPSGAPLAIADVLAMVRQIMPSPLRRAGTPIVLRGPMPGAAAALVCRGCAAADVVIAVIDRTTGTTRRIAVDRMERDRVRLVRPDRAETLRDVGNGMVEARTSQRVSRRPRAAPPFAYDRDLELVVLETRSPRHANVRAQVDDGRSVAWVDDLNALEDVP